MVKTLGLYGIAGVLFSLAQKVTVWAHANYVNQIADTFVLAEVWFFCVLFYWALKNTALRKIVVRSAIAYSIFYAITFLFITEQSTPLIRLGRDIAMIFCALVYFYYLIRKLPEENLLRFPMFWITASTIFFFCGTFFFSVTADYIVSVLNNDRAGFLAFRNFFRFGFYLMLAYAGWLDYKSIKSAVNGL